MVRYWRLLRHGAPLCSSSKYDSFSLGNRSSEMSEPRVEVHVCHSDCSRGSSPVSSKMSSGRNPDHMSLGRMGASWYHMPARLRMRRKDIWLSSLRKPSGSSSRYAEGGRNGANAAFGSFSDPGFGGAS